MSNSGKKIKNSVLQISWDAVCIASGLGIWARYIEPKILFSKRIDIKLPLPRRRKSIKAIQLSDLHFDSNFPNTLLGKLQRRIKSEQPDLIMITGDFLCNSQLQAKGLLQRFLKDLQAPLGIYAVLGNHDYDRFLAPNESGDYDIRTSATSPVIQGLKRLFSPTVLTGKTTERAKNSKPHAELVELLEDCAIVLLHNETVQVDDCINLTGFGEHMAGAVDANKAFKNYNPNLPGVLLTHNPDTIPKLLNGPGELILCGHTHGGQIYLPGIWKRLTLMENSQYHRGLQDAGNKKIYISRGIGSTFPLRFLAPPELVIITISDEGGGQ